MRIRVLVIYRQLKGFNPFFHAACKVDVSELEGLPEEAIQKAIGALVQKQVQPFIDSYPEFKEASFFSIDLADEHLPLLSLK
jgi:hypothetical protein